MQPYGVHGRSVGVFCTSRRRCTGGSRRRPCADRSARRPSMHRSASAAEAGPGCRDRRDRRLSRSINASSSASRCRRRKIVRERAHADGVGRAPLVADVDVRGGVVADEHDSEPRRRASRSNACRHALRDLPRRALGERLAVDQSRRHSTVRIGHPECRAVAASAGSAFTATGCVAWDSSGTSFIESA